MHNNSGIWGPAFFCQVFWECTYEALAFIRMSILMSILCKSCKNWVVDWRGLARNLASKAEQASCEYAHMPSLQEIILSLYRILNVAECRMSPECRLECRMSNVAECLECRRNDAKLYLVVSGSVVVWSFKACATSSPQKDVISIFWDLFSDVGLPLQSSQWSSKHDCSWHEYSHGHTLWN